MHNETMVVGRDGFVYLPEQRVSFRTQGNTEDDY